MKFIHVFATEIPTPACYCDCRDGGEGIRTRQLLASNC